MKYTKYFKALFWNPKKTEQHFFKISGFGKPRNHLKSTWVFQKIYKGPSLPIPAVIVNAFINRKIFHFDKNWMKDDPCVEDVCCCLY